MNRKDFQDTTAKSITIAETSDYSRDQTIAVSTFNALVGIGLQLCDLEATLKAGLADIAKAVKDSQPVKYVSVAKGNP